MSVPTPLLILQPTSQPTAQTLLRLFLQTELHWSRHLAEEEILEVGTAVFNSDLMRVPLANRIMDAVLPDGVAPAEAVAAAQAFYAERGSNLMEVIPSLSATSDAVWHYLKDAGWLVRNREIVRLARRPAASPFTVPPAMKIIPARASFRHARQLAEEMSAGDTQRADAAMLHLDDPHVDALLALRGGQAVAGIAVLAMGEVGRIDQMFVSERCRREGLGTLMLSRALEICARALFRHVLSSISKEEIAASSLFEKLGFESIGSVDFYQSPLAVAGKPGL
jgi:GNAT superfamily N-acetyltransferase